MLGLGVGGYVIGAWADRRYAERPDSLLRVYGYFELLIGGDGSWRLVLVAPAGTGVGCRVIFHLARGGRLVRPVVNPSYVFRGAIAVALLTPITLLMGGTLTLLIRHLVQGNVDTGGGRGSPRWTR